MATAKDFRRIALSLDGTTEAPHFDRTAFRVRRIYATLAADGKSANLMLTRDEQALKCEVAADAFSPIPNAWGARGATTAEALGALGGGIARRGDDGVAARAGQKAKPLEAVTAACRRAPVSPETSHLSPAGGL